MKLTVTLGVIMSSLIVVTPLLLWTAGELLHPAHLIWLIPLGLAAYWGGIGLAAWLGRRFR